MKCLKPNVAILAPLAKPLTIATNVRRRNLSGGAWGALRERILERDRGVCQCLDCRRLGLTKAAHEVDHILPLWKGGTDDETNLQAINRSCHAAKSAKEAAERYGGRAG